MVYQVASRFHQPPFALDHSLVGHDAALDTTDDSVVQRSIVQASSVL